MAGAFSAAHQLGQVESVHLRHVHVEQRDRYVVVREQQLERFGAAGGPKQGQARLREDGRQHVQVVRHIVNGQHRDTGEGENGADIVVGVP